MTIEVIGLDKIVEDDSLQIRECVDSGLVNKYRDLMKSNGPLGSVDVFSIGGGQYLLANGWHRLSPAPGRGDMILEGQIVAHKVAR